MKPTKNKYTELVSEIRQLVEQARQSISRKINTELLLTYWSVGRLIVLREKEENIDEKSSRQLILELSKELSLHVGKAYKLEDSEWVSKLVRITAKALPEPKIKKSE